MIYPRNTQNTKKINRRQTKHFISLKVFFRVFRVLSGLFFVSFVGCSKPSTTQPESQRSQIEVTEFITEDTVWESGKDEVYCILM